MLSLILYTLIIFVPLIEESHEINFYMHKKMFLYLSATWGRHSIQKHDV